jgi:hypothetical protein
MIDTIEIEDMEEAVYEISDDALERAADQEHPALTLGACTGLSACPADRASKGPKLRCGPSWRRD